MGHDPEQPPTGARLHHRQCEDCGKLTVQWMTRVRGAYASDGTVTAGETTWHCSTLSPAAFRQTHNA